jgi:glycosyltransferase involved in cell wall biosynthesis
MLNTENSQSQSNRNLSIDKPEENPESSTIKNSPEIFDKESIYHCSELGLSGGGIETYVASLQHQGQEGVSSKIIKSLNNIDQRQFKLLHVHSPEILLQLKGECPAVFTVHNHSIYCPSGTQYLSAQNKICQRNYSVLGCMWGKAVDACGSRRPVRVYDELSGAYFLQQTLKSIPITVIANSEYVRQQLLKHGIPAEKTITLRYGTLATRTKAAPLTQEVHNNNRILFAGRIVPDKGLEWLLKTLTYVDERVQLDIAGDGWDKPRLEKLAEKLGLNNRIVWHGWCDSDKMNKLYEQCFAVIFPSVWPEPAGLITLEAYARYRPVIASAVGGIPEHINNGETGILVAASDIKQLADAINELHCNYHKSRLMGERGHDLLMEEFTMDTHVKRLQRIYEKAIDSFHRINNK